jgi:hypothetical protein
MDEKLPPPIHSGDGVWTQKIPNSSLALNEPAPYRPLPDRVWDVINNPPKLTSDRPFVSDRDE